MRNKTVLNQIARRRVQRETLLWRYDHTRQVSQIKQDGEWVDSWDAEVLARTKKFDIETGEDQKGV